MTKQIFQTDKGQGHNGKGLEEARCVLNSVFMRLKLFTINIYFFSYFVCNLFLTIGQISKSQYNSKFSCKSARNQNLSCN